MFVFQCVFVLKNKKNMFGFQCVFVLKNTENTRNKKFKKQEEFSKNTKIVFSVFSKTVLNNSFQKHE